MSWADTRKAIQDAIVAASGLTDGKVIWEYQGTNQPALPYVALSLTPLTVVGMDSVTTDYDAGRDPGAEIALTVTGTREVGLEVSCYTAPVAGNSDALALAERIRTALILPTVSDLMAAQGVSAFDFGSVNYVPAVVSAGFRGRAVQTIRCYMPAQTVVEYVGYIAKVSGKATVTGGQTSPQDYPYTAEVT
jgi:hypothetical protein